ncbi:hypothetical protein N7532_007935 [Penicillium argentinense]|uniref:CENP-V/GFA domain-containing protein n=1 Tax=Penicillium argentinense TaxID=1131581 RepID=A0A9W9K1I8_9EURO|nr:uncharacterized protein N7532_007935 [Penicillium argentinense]KAJ5089251.1 hypothetical protein N7532_007935 [Penicillium argentinense]
MAHEPLHGSCSCGRNQYRITIPDDVTDHAEVYFDSSRDNRRFHGTPLTAWLRVPLDWYSSHTESFFPDETHSSIRRAFSPAHAPQTRRVFCGFCGTPLSFWTEEPRGEAEFMSVAIGSLFGEDQRLLEDLDLLPADLDDDESDDEDENEGKDDIQDEVSGSAVAPPGISSVVVPSFGGSGDLSRNFRHGTREGMLGGIPWFEEMVEGSRLGRLMRARRGKGVSDDQSTSIEWEVSEWHDDSSGGEYMRQVETSSGGRTTGKRKRGLQANVDSPQKRA